MSTTRTRLVGTRAEQCRRVTSPEIPELPYPARAMQIAPADRQFQVAAERVKQVREGARAGDPARRRPMTDWRSRGYDN